MSDALLLVERVRNTIALGESHFREFKSALEGPPQAKKSRPTKHICAEIGEALVAFANADGGELLIGVEDNGQITGVPHSTEDIEKLLQAHRTHVYEKHALPLLNATTVELDEKTLLFFSVQKGTTEVYQLPDGRCVCRRDKATVPETPNQILFDRQEIKSREYDRLFVDGAKVVDLDTDLLETMADAFLKGLSVERYLQQIGLAEYANNGIRLRRAATLLFGKDIQRWHSRSQVRVIKVSGTELKSGDHYNVQSDEIVQGNIFQLLTKSWDVLRPFLAYKTEFGTDARFEQKYLYPEGACREALVNAIAHRDYCSQNGVEVYIFNDRMEIRSPGAILSTLTLQDLSQLQGVHESRNSMISRVLRENKFMRELGEGMRRMFELMEQNELDKPTIQSDFAAFSITLPNKSVFSVQQEQWISLFDKASLSPLQKKIVAAGVNGRDLSPSEIYQAMNTDDRDTYDREVTGLRQSNILIEAISNASANWLAKQQKIPKSQIPRFKIQVPVDVPTVSGPSNRFSDVDASRAVYISNLPLDLKIEDLKQLFEKCGNIERVHVPKVGHGHLIQGFGFIAFSDSMSAAQAIQVLDKTEFGGRIIAVEQYAVRNESRGRRGGRGRGRR